MGPTNVMQVTTNNTTMNPTTMRLVLKYPHIFFQGCVVHTLNLLSKDWATQQWIMNLLLEAKIVLKFFKKGHMPFTIFWNYKKYSLLMSALTRFALNFIAIAHLLKVKKSLVKTMANPQ